MDISGSGSVRFHPAGFGFGSVSPGQVRVRFGFGPPGFGFGLETGSVRIRHSNPGLTRGLVFELGHGGHGHGCTPLSTSLVGESQTDVPAQLRKRCESAMRGLGYGSHIERSVVSSRLTQLPPVGSTTQDCGGHTLPTSRM